MTLQFDSPTLIDTGGADPPTAAPIHIVTALIVGVPTLALVAGVYQLWGGGPSVLTIVLAALLYVVTGHGVTIGYHRMLTHKSFVPTRPLKLALIACGSMAFEGGPIAWVANHRQHHVFADTARDPHSPMSSGGRLGQLKALWHAHIGWLFTFNATRVRRHAADLLADRDLVVMNALFPVWCVISLALPFALGWFIGGTLAAALEALLWAGLVRVCILHHATWSVNSLCHASGRRRFATDDGSANVAWLAPLSLGESFHNAHHAFPRSARHGMVWNQFDSSWLLIRSFERAGWAQRVYVPTAAALMSRSNDAAGTWAGGPIYQRLRDR